jgi:hypothetical protein
MRDENGMSNLSLTNPDTKEQPLIPAFSPYEGEKENRSLVLQQASGLDFRD